MLTDDRDFVSLPYVQGVLLSLSRDIEGLSKQRAEFLRSIAGELRRLHEDELTRLRAEVERLRKAIARIANGLRDSGRVRADFVPSREVFADMLDALAREDGEG